MPADFSRSGDVYLSPDYESARNRAEVRINGGVGAITVQSGL